MNHSADACAGKGLVLGSGSGNSKQVRARKATVCCGSTGTRWRMFRGRMQASQFVSYGRCKFKRKPLIFTSLSHRGKTRGVGLETARVYGMNTLIHSTRSRRRGFTVKVTSEGRLGTALRQTAVQWCGVEAA